MIIRSVISGYHAPAECHLRTKGVALGSWFESLTTSGFDPVRPEAAEGLTTSGFDPVCPEAAEGLTTSGFDPVRPEALEGRTGYLYSS